VLARAGELLAGFEGDELKPNPNKRARARRPATNQLSLFAPGADPSVAGRGVVERLQALDVNRLSPLEALTLLAELKGQLRG
jgi:hypothetical protein